MQGTLYVTPPATGEGPWPPSASPDESGQTSIMQGTLSARPWQEWADTEIAPNSGGKVTYFDAGLKGVSNTEVAAIWVPCYAHETTSKKPWSMTVFAHALKPLEASASESRKTLIDLATSFARQAHKDAKCDLPSKLPS
ncbi:hypothetical protein ABTY98_42095 [Streptomyces sp. NPDC096040]|uniref:hypothetical protein n=1 Tax=Streptomyces sp. NPDC096040 TaxID=3155541 RepID=UPI0033194107